MATLKYIGTYQIPTFAVSAIINDDYSGINDDDEKAIKNFLDGFSGGFIADWSQNIDNPYFSAYNDILGYIGAEVVDVDFYSIN